MNVNDLVHLMLAAIGFSILLWLLRHALKDMITVKMAQRKPVYNVVIILLCLIYLVKILVADLMPYLG